MDIIHMVHQSQQMDIIMLHLHHHHLFHHHHHHHQMAIVLHQVHHQHQHQLMDMQVITISKCTITQAWPIIKQLLLQLHQMDNHGNKQLHQLVIHQYHLLKHHNHFKKETKKNIIPSQYSTTKKTSNRLVKTME